MKGGACCTVSSCRNSTAKKGIKFFRFPNPREPERSRRWILACNRKDLLDKDPYYLYKNRRICSAHFPDSMYLNDLKNRLVATAEPTLNLGFSKPIAPLEEGKVWVSKTSIFKKAKKTIPKGPNNYFTFTPKARVVNCENSTSTLLDIDLGSYNLNEHPSMDNLSRICRVCFMEDNVQDIFDLKFDRLFLSDIVQLHTTIELRRNGIISHKMCISCIEELTRSYLFFKKFQNADKVLNEIALKDELIVLNKSLQHRDDSNDLTSEHCCDSDLQSASPSLIDSQSQSQDSNFKIEIIDEFCGNTVDFNVMSSFDEHITLNEEIVTLDDDNLIIDFDNINDSSRLGGISVLDLGCDSTSEMVSSFDKKCERMEHTANINPVNEPARATKAPTKLQCDRCSKYFCSIDSLKNHVRKHLNPHRVTCYICDKTYSSKTALKTHILTHTGERPFRCEVCGLQFRQHSHYMTHKRTHTGEKPFSCHLCSARFASTGLLDMHVRKKHTHQPVCRCNICGQGFFEKRMLKRHQASKHDGGKLAADHSSSSSVRSMHNQINTKGINLDLRNCLEGQSDTHDGNEDIRAAMRFYI